MGIADSIARLAATFIAVIQTRAELIAVEVEEEALRYFSYLLLALAAMFFLGIAILLVILLIIAVYWDTHRIEVLLTLIGLSCIAGLSLGLKVRNRYREKPALLGHTMLELSRDVDALKSST